MGRKYFTISYDDGLEQDEKLIALMKQYGIRGTFNLSSGLFGKKSYIRRIGDMGMDADSNRKGKCVNHFILPKDRAVSIYRDVEVASHGKHHLNETKLSDSELREEIEEDAAFLSDMFQKPVHGHIVPYGAVNAEVREVMAGAGLTYGRMATMMKKPVDFKARVRDGMIVPTCWHLDSFAVPCLEKFLSTPAEDGDLVFYMWGHGYELDYGTKRGNWEYIERIFRMAKDAEDVIKVTNGELVEMGIYPAVSL